ncbi:MAG TPA: phosphotransferase [Thermoleophilaceae bacterium]|nr:phosphotransferase [Thermoleophilaceae bacterium]
MAVPREAYGEAVWASDAWRAEAVAWLDQRLADAGMRRTGDVEHLHVRPWATAMRAPTTRGPVWMKAAGPATAFEVGLYELLHRIAPGHVLRPIATDTERAWMVLEDGGPTVEDTMEGEELVRAMEAALRRYAELQRLAAPHAEELVALGAADMRPAVLPRRFEEALEATGGGAERTRLEALRPDVARWCDELARAPAEPSIDHNDLHPDNVFAGPPPRAYDWGDSVVAHPFATMLATLDFLQHHTLHCEPGDPRLVRARDAYLEGFSDLAPHDELVRTLDLARRLGLIAHALTWHRVLAAIQPEEVPEGWGEMPLGFLTRLLDDAV